MRESQEIQRQLSSRWERTLKACKTSRAKAHMAIHGAASDMGVARNGGRRGARFGQQAILASFEKLTSPLDNPFFWSHEIVARPSFDGLDFCEAQKKERENFHLDLEKIHVHLGGGHDHIYPFLMALQIFKRPIHVINIDAHLDTRTDPYPHSGTPFRQFAKTKSVSFRLTQIGIHSFSNAESNYTDLPKSTQAIINLNALDTLSLSDEDLTILSLDCDGLDSSFFSGVSAVNPLGLTKSQLILIWNFYLRSIKHQPIVGIYEYNPVYDDLSRAGANFLASFLYFIAQKKLIIYEA